MATSKDDDKRQRPMTFEEYIMNPLGKHNAVFSNRDMYKRLYSDKWDKILLREAGKINYKVFSDKANDIYYIYINIPSEVVPKFYYDVVVQLYPVGEENILHTNLKNYGVRFYSNDPSFVFTYLRVFLKNDMFIESLKNKSPRLAVKKDPVEKNPKEIIGYVKSLYFAYLFMKSKNLFSKTYLDTISSPYHKNTFDSLVRQADAVIDKRQELGEKLAKEKAKEKQRSINTSEANRKKALDARSPTIGPDLKIGTVSSTKRVNRVGGVKNTTIKKSKK